MGGEIEWGWKSIGRNNGWNVSKLGKSINLHIQESEQTPKEEPHPKSMSRHIIIMKFLKTKDKKSRK